MMWPRLRLLHELLTEHGSIWITLDDNEAQRGKLILDEIFGEDAFVASIAWEARYSVSNDASISNSHNYILVYSKAPETWKKIRNQVARSEQQAKQYSNPDDDPKGPWRAIPWDAPNIRENLSYQIKTIKGNVRYPPKGRCWSREENKWKEICDAGLAYFGKDEDGVHPTRGIWRRPGLWSLIRGGSTKLPDIQTKRAKNSLHSGWTSTTRQHAVRRRGQGRLQRA